MLVYQRVTTNDKQSMAISWRKWVVFPCENGESNLNSDIFNEENEPMII